jgi:hypothetical protein
VRSGTLRWHSGAEHTEMRVPLWAQSAVKFMVNAHQRWPIAAAHDLVYNNDVPVLNQLVRRLVEVGFLEEAPAALDGVAHSPDMR